MTASTTAGMIQPSTSATMKATRYKPANVR